MAEIPQLKTITAADIIIRIAKAWYQALNEVTAFGFKGLIQRYKAVDALAGQHLNIINHNEVILTGISGGINEQGQLLVRQGQQTHAISVGEVSVRSLETQPSS